MYGELYRVPGVRVGVATNNPTAGGVTLAECYPLIEDEKGILEIGEVDDDGCGVMMCYPESNAYIYPTFLIPELRTFSKLVTLSLIMTNQILYSST